LVSVRSTGRPQSAPPIGQTLSALSGKNVSQIAIFDENAQKEQTLSAKFKFYLPTASPIYYIQNMIQDHPERDKNLMVVAATEGYAVRPIRSERVQVVCGGGGSSLGGASNLQILNKFDFPCLQELSLMLP